MDDPRVNHPEYYNKGKIEVKDFIKDQLDAFEHGSYRGFLVGCIFQYLCRFSHKEDPVLDLKKLGWYLEELIDSYAELEKIDIVPEPEKSA